VSGALRLGRRRRWSPPRAPAHPARHLRLPRSGSPSYPTDGGTPAARWRAFGWHQRRRRQAGAVGGGRSGRWRDPGRAAGELRPADGVRAPVPSH